MSESICEVFACFGFMEDFLTSHCLPGPDLSPHPWPTMSSVVLLNFVLALARQRKPQITRYFATQMLPCHKLKSDSEGYK
jgi:hypothetical protein